MFEKFFGGKEPTHEEHSFFLGDLEKRRKEHTEVEEEEQETVMEHVDAPAQGTLIKAGSKESAPKRRPLANPEAMPKRTEKKAVKALTKTEEVKKTSPEKSAPAGTKKPPLSDHEIDTLFVVKQILAEKKKGKEKKEPSAPLTKEEKENQIKASLDGMYDVYRDPELAMGKRLKPAELARYAVLFLCIFGFLTAGAFVFYKLYEYHRSYVINTELQDLVSSKDRFQDEYLKKTPACTVTLTPEAILAGEKAEEKSGTETYTEKQQNLVNKLAQLKKLNPDTAGWITIGGTVVNYPVVRSDIKNYYLRRDFYGKSLSAGTIYIDERNSASLAENRNTVIYGHNMTDGSMFASVHDFAHASVFFNATIEIATENGIYIYKPFSVHESNAYDNYFETDFETDEEFIGFCEQMASLSIYQTELGFDKNTQIVTLSTCTNDENYRDGRFAVHAVLVKVIR